jgi:hypothetical protein
MYLLELYTFLYTLHYFVRDANVVRCVFVVTEAHESPMRGIRRVVPALRNLSFKESRIAVPLD